MQRLCRVASGWKLGTDIPVKVLREFVAQPQDHCNEKFNGRGQSNPLREHIVVRPLDSQKQQIVDISHGSRHGKEGLIVLRKILFGFAIEIVNALAFKLHQCTEPIIIDGIQQVPFSVSKSPEVLHRKVDSPLFRIGLDVAQDVCQLERNAKMNGILFRRLMMIAKNFRADKPDGRCRAITGTVEDPQTSHTGFW